MTDDIKNRYDLNCLPISKTTRDGLTKENIDQIGTIGRMLSLQDDFMEGLLSSIQKTVQSIELRLNAIELRLDKIELNLEDKEGRLKILEKYMSPQASFMRIGLGVIIGIFVSVLSFIFIHPYLK